ncbi:MAG: trehalose-6-phosphate synthase, partial [Gammaproteobacteria bacterium]|nr:trehalose-6-phosphate synthase [Gammaproteobacteria bacterium]
HLHDRSLIIGVDRLDYSKGLEERFRAVERLLKNYPENRGQVSYIQIAPKTRSGVREYLDIRHALEQVASEINGEFADIDWIPIRYLNRAFDRPTLMSFLRQAQVGLVTPVRDGMNLVAKEFVASQDPKDPGALVLSTMAGAAKELTDAVLVNPYDIEGVAEGIQTALRMPLEERQERHRSMIEVLRRNDINTWRKRFVDALEQSRASS